MAAPRPRSKKSKTPEYFCQLGFLEQTQKRTEKLNWTEFYTSEDRDDLEAFQKKVEAFVVNSASTGLSSRLSRKIKSHGNARIHYITKEDSDAEASSSGESDGSDQSNDVNGIDHNSEDSGAAPSRIDDVFELTDELKRTPKKSRKTALGQRGPRTPKTPNRINKAGTPGSRGYRIMAPLEVTPLPSRVSLSINKNTLSPHQLARQRLHVAEVPASLPCREAEFAAIFEQVESAIIENESALIYISGTPGTGKTATVREVINSLQQKVLDEELFPFKFVELNGMKLPEPTQAYSRLWETLTGQRVTPNHALSLLQTHFTSRNTSRMPTVVLMDELDQLTTTKQEVMYNFFQWPNMPNTRLIVIAVANTMDLPERTLAHKVSSRLGLTRIAFPAYTRPQLNEIIKSRLSNVETIVVESAAIDYACMRVSRVSGDARRALDICRRAFELAEPGFDSTLSSPSKTLKKVQGQPAAGIINMKIMQQAFNEMTSSPLQMYLKGLPFACKILLKALLACTRRSGLTDSVLGDLMEDAARICKVNSHPDLQRIMGLLQPSDMTRTAKCLAQSGIIYLEDTKKGERNAKIRLKVPESELVSSWAEDGEMSAIS